MLNMQILVAHYTHSTVELVYRRAKISLTKSCYEFFQRQRVVHIKHHQGIKKYPSCLKVMLTVMTNKLSNKLKRLALF